MDMIGWSLNAIDKIFSTRKQPTGEAACPTGTFSAGYAEDSWGKWRVVCLSILSMEDVEDVYQFGFMITGFLLFGAGGFLIYRNVRKVLAAVLAMVKLPIMIEGLCRAYGAQTQAIGELNRKLDAIHEPLRRMDANLV